MNGLPLADAEARERFTQEVDMSFSVVAPAGVGKTTAITRRVACLAMADLRRLRGGGDRRDCLLPRLVVVTYTKKAAENLASRAESACQAIFREFRNEGATTPQLWEHEFPALMRDSFFGTIHSLAHRLLREYGHFLGVSPQTEIVTDPEPLWRQYLAGCGQPDDCLPVESRAFLRRLVATDQYLRLAREWPLAQPDPEPPPRPPQLDKTWLAEILEFAPSHQRSVDSVQEGQWQIRRWWKLWERGDRLATLPVITKGGREFEGLVDKFFEPLRSWRAHASAFLASHHARRFLRFRLDRGLLTYDDLIYLAGQLISIPAYQEVLSGRKPVVILDEAQDTDPAQFSLLLGLSAEGRNFLPGHPVPWSPPRGRFCMVGDPQQSIYADRADPAYYLEIEKTLGERGLLERLAFTTTFRCPERLVTLANTWFPAIFDSIEQVKYVPLQTPPDSENRGAVWRIAIAPGENQPGADGKTVQKQRRLEAHAWSLWLQESAQSLLKGYDPSQIAFLSPRVEWLTILAEELRQAGFPVQILSSRNTLANRPAFAWLLALLVAMQEPANSYELTGLLREVFGHDDPSLVECRAKYGPFSLLEIPEEWERAGPKFPAPIRTLHHLASLRAQILGLPMGRACRFLAEETSLRDRLRGLEGCVPDEEERLLEELLWEAHAAERKGLSMAQWCDCLKMRAHESTGEETVLPGHLQLLTVHKAKGLEWEVVALPFLNQQQTRRSDSYPFLDTAGPGQPVWPVFDQRQARLLSSGDRKTRESRQRERLAYVAMTRTKEILLLSDWLEGKGTGKGSAPSSFAGSLRCTDHGPNLGSFSALPHAPADPEQWPPTRSRMITSDDAGQLVLPYHEEEKEWWVKGKLHLEVHTPARKTPSSLAVHGPDPVTRAREDALWETEEEQRGQALHYGLWWHEVMEHLPWKTPSEWDNHFRKKLDACPSPERGERELRQFRTSSFWDKMLWDEWTVVNEWPFLWRSPQGVVYEGLVDWLAWKDSARQWCLIDWKTDQLEAGGAVGLRERYGDQVRIYAGAVEALRPAKVEAWLYSTFLGDWIEVPWQE